MITCQHASRCKFPQRGDHVVWIEPPRVIYVDVGQSNDAFSIDEKCGRHGQVLRAIGAVEEIERVAKLAVKLLQFSPIWKTMPNCLATLFPTSLSTRKVSSSFTITGPGTPGTETDGVLIGNTGSINTYPITVRNDTISNCSSGISVVERTDVTINNITFNEPALLENGINVIGVCLEGSNSSTVSNCTFIVPVADTGLTAFGIIDSESTGGNSYNNDTFVNMPNSLYVTAWNSGGESPGRQTPPLSTLTLDRCQFAAPPSN